VGSILILGDQQFLESDWVDEISAGEGRVTLASSLDQTRSDTFDIIFTNLSLPTEPLSSLGELSKRDSVLVVAEKHLNIVELVKGGAHYVLSGNIEPQDAKWVLESALRIKRKKQFPQPGTLKSRFDFNASAQPTGPYHLALLDSLEGIKQITREEKMKLLLAYQEVITNAIDHGCLELDSRLKEFLNFEGVDAFSVEKKRRLADPYFGDRRVFVEASFSEGTFSLVVEDEGRGFLPNIYLKLEPDRVYGRGLELLQCVMDEVIFHNHGRKVELTKRYGAKI